MTHHVQQPGTRVPTIITPGTLAEAIEAMASPRSRPIAGGTDLLIELARGEYSDLETLVDLTRVPGLDTISQNGGTQDGGTQDGGTITIGALVTHNRVVADPILQRFAAPLVQACREVGSPQLRNRATVAGNLVTASPANDTISALLALDAKVTVASAGGERHLPLAQFHTGFRQTALEPGELVTAISFPALVEPWRGIFLKLGLRKAQAISVVHLAVVARLGQPGAAVDGNTDEAAPVIDEIRIAMGSVAATVERATEVEALLRGSPLTVDAIEAAAAAASATIQPIDDVRATADYRVATVAEMTRRALAAVTDDAGIVEADPVVLWGDGDGHWPTGPERSTTHDAATPVKATVNGQAVSQPRGDGTLLDWLRDGGRTGVKEGCAEGECGSCTVHLDGLAVLSCLVPASRAEGTDIVTVEGVQDLAGPTGRLHPLQELFVETGAVQCGYCIPGFLVAGAKLLEERPNPTETDVVDGLAGNLCRCTGYYKIVDAFLRTGERTGERAGSGTTAAPNQEEAS